MDSAVAKIHRAAPRTAPSATYTTWAVLREPAECKMEGVGLRKDTPLESQSKQVGRGRDKWVPHHFGIQGYGWCTGEEELVPCGVNASMVRTVMVLIGFHTDMVRNNRQAKTTVTGGPIKCYFQCLRMCDCANTHTALSTFLMVIQSYTIITILWKGFALESKRTTLSVLSLS